MGSLKTLVVAAAAVVALGLLGSSDCRAADRPNPVRLGSGSLSHYHWWVNVHRGQTRNVPCIDLNLVDEVAKLPIERKVTESSCRRVQPLPNALGIVDELDQPKATLLAMGFPREARAVTLVFHGHLKRRTMPLELLSPLKVRKGKLQAFRYFTFAFQGDSCVSRFITYDKRGHVLFDGGRMNCQV